MVIFFGASWTPGAYRVVVGMYDLSIIVRLPILAADGSATGDHLLLENLEIQ